MEPSPKTRLAITITGAGMASLLMLAASSRPAPSPVLSQETITLSDFAISGDLNDLYPGQQTTLDVQVTNPQTFSIRVTAIEVTTHDAAPGCSSSWLHFAPMVDSVDITAGSTSPVPLPATLDFNAPETCRNATWPLTLHATAVETPGSVTPPATTPTTAPGWPGENHHPEQLARTGIQLANLLAAGILLIATGLLVRPTARRQKP